MINKIEAIPMYFKRSPWSLLPKPKWTSGRFLSIRVRTNDRKWSRAVRQLARSGPDGRQWSGSCANRGRLWLAGVVSRMAAYSGWKC